MRAFNFLREKDTGKISKKRIAIIAVVLLLAAAIITPPVAKIIRYNTPIESDTAELQERTIEYQGRTYHLMCEYAKLFDFEIDKRVGRKGVVFHTNYYTLKNDENRNFLYVTEIHEGYLYSTIPINYDYFSKPTNPKEIQLTLDDEEITIDDRYYIDYFYLLTYYHSDFKIEYDPNECTIIKSKIIPKDSLAVSYHYQHDAFIYNGIEWLVMGEFEYDGETKKCYAYALDDAKMRDAFEKIGIKYFPELFYETYDYSRYYVNADIIIDPSMADIAD